MKNNVRQLLFWKISEDFPEEKDMTQAQLAGVQALLDKLKENESERQAILDLLKVKSRGKILFMPQLIQSVCSGYYSGHEYLLDEFVPRKDIEAMNSEGILTDCQYYSICYAHPDHLSFNVDKFYNRTELQDVLGVSNEGFKKLVEQFDLPCFHKSPSNGVDTYSAIEVHRWMIRRARTSTKMRSLIPDYDHLGHGSNLGGLYDLYHLHDYRKRCTDKRLTRPKRKTA